MNCIDQAHYIFRTLGELWVKRKSEWDRRKNGEKNYNIGLIVNTHFLILIITACRMSTGFRTGNIQMDRKKCTRCEMWCEWNAAKEYYATRQGHRCMNFLHISHWISLLAHTLTFHCSRRSHCAVKMPQIQSTIKIWYPRWTTDMAKMERKKKSNQ